MKIRMILLIMAIGMVSIANAQESEKQASTFTLVLNQDNVFGFYPAAFGSFGLNDKLSMTFYGIFWTNPGYGSILDGSDLWLETGVGLSFTALEDKLLINPSLGFTHGKLLSDGPRSTFGEGIVPNLALFFGDSNFEAEVYLGYYKALKNEGPLSGDYLLYWLLPGYKLTKNISLGLHYEGFVLSKVQEGETGTMYNAIGGYVKFMIRDLYAFRFSAGKNTESTEIYAPNFYKLNLVIPF